MEIWIQKIWKTIRRQTYQVFLESGFFTWDGKSVFEQIIFENSIIIQCCNWIYNDLLVISPLMDVWFLPQGFSKQCFSEHLCVTLDYFFKINNFKSINMCKTLEKYFRLPLQKCVRQFESVCVRYSFICSLLSWPHSIHPATLMLGLPSRNLII